MLPFKIVGSALFFYLSLDKVSCQLVRYLYCLNEISKLSFWLSCCVWQSQNPAVEVISVVSLLVVCITTGKSTIFPAVQTENIFDRGVFLHFLTEVQPSQCYSNQDLCFSLSSLCLKRRLSLILQSYITGLDSYYF